MKKQVLILHGWGLSGNRYTQLVGEFDAKKYSVYTIDLPGFGNQPLSSTLTLSDYVEFVRNFLRQKKIKSALFIGHSFGGRIATKFACVYPEMVEKIVLTGAPIIRHMSYKKKIAGIIAKTGGIFLQRAPDSLQKLFRKILYHSIGEFDYYNAGRLKEVLKNILNEDLTLYAKKIKQPVLLVWGEDDTFTPKNDVHEIQKLIPQAKTVIIKGIGHKLPYENPSLFYQHLKSFI